VGKFNGGYLLALCVRVVQSELDVGGEYHLYVVVVSVIYFSLIAFGLVWFDVEELCCG